MLKYILNKTVYVIRKGDSIAEIRELDGKWIIVWFSNVRLLTSDDLRQINVTNLILFMAASATSLVVFGLYVFFASDMQVCAMLQIGEIC